MRRGKQVEVPSPGQNQKVAAFGGINYATGESLSHVPNVAKGGKNSAQFLVGLWKLVAHARRRRRKVILLIDNGPIHTAKKVEAFLEEPAIKKLIKVEWLPKYAPDLNDQERVWKFVKEHGVANVLFAGRDNLRDHVIKLLDAINRDPKAMMTIVLGQRHRASHIRKKILGGT